MRRIQVDKDIQPLSEFRSNAAAMLERVRSTKRPLVLTQRGRSAAVLVDVAEYDRLIGELDLLREVKQAETQLAEGQGVSHEQACARLLARYGE